MKTLSLQINDVHYACIEAGQGPLLLLTHGTFGGKELMLPQLNHLKRKFRCVALDWPGHGESGFRQGGWTVQDLVKDTVSLMGALGETRAFLAGVSQGGAVSMRVALDHPERVLGLVNLCAGTGVPPPAVLGRLETIAATLAEQRDESVRRRAAEEFAAALFHAPGFPLKQPARFAAEIDLMLAHPRRSVRWLPGVPKSYEEIGPRLADLRCPTLVLWGDQDKRPALGAQLAAAIPNAELVNIGGAGHHVNVDAPEETSLAMDSFLSRSSAASAQR